MYGLPNSFIVGTIRRVGYSLKMPKAQETETGWSRLMGESMKWLDKKAKQKRAKQRLCKKHNVNLS